uniref:Uncharacterized protein n=1 Tax=Tanacetum cinerariifolium TaxID=118510 RepID=A0A699U3I0_TANCI|nr:hypothetical protein [Tanacetum cinerariifolium]
MVNPTIYVSCIKKFWATTTVKKVNDVVQLRALIDGKKVVVSEGIIRRDLHLDDADGVECLPNEEIFKELARMGYEKPPPKLTFYLQAQIIDKMVVVTEAIIRRDLHLDDADGVERLSNAEIFEELSRMVYEKPPPKLTFYKAFFFV